jgi:integrase
VTCTLRGGELSRMNCEHLAMRDGRWVFLDFKGKGNKTRSVAVPLWVKQEIDGWLEVAGIEKGPIFRRVLANGRGLIDQPFSFRLYSGANPFH